MFKGNEQLKLGEKNRSKFRIRILFKCREFIAKSYSSTCSRRNKEIANV